MVTLQTAKTNSGIKVNLTVKLLQPAFQNLVKFNTYDWIIQGKPELNVEFEDEESRDTFLGGFMQLISK